MPMNITYQHQCKAMDRQESCSQDGKTFVDRPTSRYGTSYIVVPVCEESGLSLIEVKREVF